MTSQDARGDTITPARDAFGHAPTITHHAATHRASRTIASRIAASAAPPPENLSTTTLHFLVTAIVASR
jgi:hypothetical protein